jgi:hypothetical protein
VHRNLSNLLSILCYPILCAQEGVLFNSFNAVFFFVCTGRCTVRFIQCCVPVCVHRKVYCSIHLSLSCYLLCVHRKVYSELAKVAVESEAQSTYLQQIESMEPAIRCVK